MCPNPIYYRRIHAIGFAYDPDAIAYFNQLSPQPSTAYKNAINTFVLTLKSYSIWSKLDRLWIHAGEYQQNARISLPNPTSTAITEVNSPTWTANRGYTFNKTSNYINTNYLPSTGVNFLQNNAAMFAYLRDRGTANGSDGCFGGGFQTYWLINVIVSRQFTLNDGAATTGVASGASNTFVHTLRTDAVNTSLYANGVLDKTNANASAGRPAFNAYFGCRNQAGTPGTFNDGQYSISGFGSGDINAANFYTAVSTLKTALGF